MRTFTDKINKKEEDEAHKLTDLNEKLIEKEKLLQNLSERLQKYKRKETIEKDVHVNEIAEKESKIKALEVKMKETLAQEKESHSLFTEKLVKEAREKDREVEDSRLKYENMKEKSRKYKNEAKLGANEVGQIESKVAEMEARIGKLEKELEEKEGILVEMDIQRKKSETEVSFLYFCYLLWVGIYLGVGRFTKKDQNLKFIFLIDIIVRLPGSTVFSW